jgi:hypothetical protein
MSGMKPGKREGSVDEEDRIKQCQSAVPFKVNASMLSEYM